MENNNFIFFSITKAIVASTAFKILQNKTLCTAEYYDIIILFLFPFVNSIFNFHIIKKFFPGILILFIFECCQNI